jgi:Protein of unknown function (DUF3467)
VAEEQKNEGQPSEAEEDQGSRFRFQADYRSGFPTVYSNFALVSHTADDLSLDFCLLAPPYNPQFETKTVAVPVVARVIIPSGMVEGLVEALRLQSGKQASEREAGGVIIPVQGQEAGPSEHKS